MTTTGPGIGGYGLGGDPHQLGVGTADPDEQYRAALTVASRGDIPVAERVELLAMLGLTGVARSRRAPGSGA